jgi:hypothetical protein
MQIRSNIEEFRWTEDVMNSVISVFERPKYKVKTKLIKVEENTKSNRIKKSMISHYEFILFVTDMPKDSCTFDLRFRFTEEGTNITIEFRNFEKWWEQEDISEFSRSTLFRKGHSRKVRQFAVFAANAVKKRVDARRTFDVVSA